MKSAGWRTTVLLGLACGAMLMCWPVTGQTADAMSGRLRDLVDAPSAREAIARVAYAEAGGQGDSGLAGVVYTVLNRLASGRWGGSIEAVVNARGQFEPVMRAGGHWRALTPASGQQRARIDTILNLALDGWLPDLTGGALYFQNPSIVAARAAAGQVAPRLVHFGGAAPSVIIGDHAFYRAVGGSPAAEDPVSPPESIFVSRAPVDSSSPGVRGLFVLRDGQVVEALRRR